MADPDYASWLTKQQAADAIGVTTKTIERLAQAGQIQQARWQRPTGGPTLAVYFPDDVARIAQERQPGPLAPFVVPAGAEPSTNGNGSGSTALAHMESTPDSSGIQLAPGEEFFRVLVAAAGRVLSETSQTPTLFLTVDEAAAILNWTRGDVRKAVRAGELAARNTALKDWRRWRIRRADLEAL